MEHQVTVKRHQPRLAFGVSAGLRPWLGELGVALEGLGYDELWSNDVPGASGLDTLAAAAEATNRLRLAVGVIALRKASPDAIAERVATSGLPADRLTVGVGSGSGRSLEAVRRGISALRLLLPGHVIGLAAVGPRMAELGGAASDAVLLNWAGPRLAIERRQLVEAVAAAAGRPVPRVAAYVRVAVGRDAHERLASEQARYVGYGGSYRRVIDAQVASGESVIGVVAEEPGGVAPALPGYRSALDTVVIRGLPAEDTLEAWLDVARAATLRA
jgi:alkanesulfonate monooxygenase SsuD/methylene tetrahydromethanopterin reductase-like flavin-dependent oxidoreductase (luciferase family)